ncbi:MAG: DUF3810 domain-containing protein [Christensenellaceae bacterium]|jgi:hypothetical protein|nr:DUF3810 domain-containing protein [Christensenellaceae bacterium]
MKPHAAQQNTWRALLRRLPWLLMLPLGLYLPRLAAAHPSIVERWFSRGLYPYVSAALGGLFSILPFSFAEILLYALPLCAAAALLWSLALWLRRRIPLQRVVSVLLTLCIIGSAMLCAFYPLWGFNYARPTLYELLELEPAEYSADQLKTLCSKLASQAALLRGQVPEDAQDVFTLPQGYRAYFARLPAAYARLGQSVPLFARKTYPAKGVLASMGMSRGGIAGIYIPYTAECNVNVDQPPLLLLSSAAHETAHYLGIAKEDEANFVAYLACLRAGDPAIAYSGVMLALIHATNQLYRADPDGFAAVRGLYSDGMVRDLMAYNAYWDAYEGAVQEAVTDMNDHYLKHNQQTTGVQSYGLMVDLLLAWESKGFEK